MPMSAYETALTSLRAARDALNALDLRAAAAALAEHDASVCAALSAEPAGLAVSEAEMLGAAQAELLAQLVAVQKGVAAELSQTRKSGQAARAYLGNAGE